MFYLLNKWLGSGLGNRELQEQTDQSRDGCGGIRRWEFIYIIFTEIYCDIFGVI